MRYYSERKKVKRGWDIFWCTKKDNRIRGERKREQINQQLGEVNQIAVWRGKCERERERKDGFVYDYPPATHTHTHIITSYQALISVLLLLHGFLSFSLFGTRFANLCTCLPASLSFVVCWHSLIGKLDSSNGSIFWWFSIFKLWWHQQQRQQKSWKLKE